MSPGFPLSSALGTATPRAHKAPLRSGSRRDCPHPRGTTAPLSPGRGQLREGLGHGGFAGTSHKEFPVHSLGAFPTKSGDWGAHHQSQSPYGFPHGEIPAHSGGFMDLEGSRPNSKGFWAPKAPRDPLPVRFEGKRAEKQHHGFPRGIQGFLRARKKRDKIQTAAKIERTNPPWGRFRSWLHRSMRIVGTIGTAPRPWLIPAAGICHPKKKLDEGKTPVPARPFWGENPRAAPKIWGDNDRGSCVTFPTGSGALQTPLGCN